MTIHFPSKVIFYWQIKIDKIRNNKNDAVSIYLGTILRLVHNYGMTILDIIPYGLNRVRDHIPQAHRITFNNLVFNGLPCVAHDRMCGQPTTGWKRVKLYNKITTMQSRTQRNVLICQLALPRFHSTHHEPNSKRTTVLAFFLYVRHDKRSRWHTKLLLYWINLTLKKYQKPEPLQNICK